MAPVSLPPGFRFHPSDEEIVGYYLKRKINGRKIELDIIPAVDLYKCEPWDLPDKSFLPNRDLEWYFFSPRDRKYPNGSRTNRATKVGYWKATGKDRKITSRSSVIGLKKTLVFYKGRAPQGKRTDWIMHEYRLDETQCEGTSGLQDAYVLCRVFKKNEIQPNDNNSEQLMGDSPIATANCLSDKISSEGFPQDQCDKSYSVVKHEDIGTQGDSRFPSEVSSDSPTNTIDNTSIVDPWLNVINESTDSPYIFKAPVGLMDNLNANSPVVRTSEQAAVLPLPKEENISRGLLDVRFDHDNCQSHFSSFSQELESGSEVEAKIITEILAKASENADILVETSPFENALFYNSCSGRFCSSFFEDSAVFENPYYFWKD